MFRITQLYDRYSQAIEKLQPLFLLGIRGYWGYQFALTGWGKLTHVDRVTTWFDSLGIPFPELNVYLAGGTEFFGGIALLLGLGGRIATVPLIFVMAVAYGTSDREYLLQIFSNPDAFVMSAPFLFLLASLIILLYGPGPISLDRLIAQFVRNETPTTVPPHAPVPAK